MMSFFVRKHLYQKQNLSLIFKLFSFVLCMGFSVNSFAAIVVPAAADPSRISEQLFSPPEKKKEFPGISAPELKKKEPTAAAKKIRFVLEDLVISGNTVLSEKELSPLYQQYMGKKISLAELQDIAHAITVKYRKGGYILSKAIVPPQRIGKDGLAHIQVVEGSVVHVSATGELDDGLRDLLLAYGDRIMRSKPLHIDALERYALLANDLPGSTVKVVVIPSRETPGTAELNFVVEQESRFEGHVAVDNRGTRYLGPGQVRAGIAVNALFTGSETRLHGVAATDFEELRYLSLEHKQSIGSNGATFHFVADVSQTEPGFDLEEFDVEGESYGLSAKISYPLVRQRKQNLTVEGGFRAENSKTDILGERLYKDQMRVLFGGLSYEFADQMRGVNFLSLDLSQGIDGLGAGSKGGIQRSRPDGEFDFTKLNWRASRLQHLWSYFSILVDLEGQLTSDGMLSSEEFGFGGPEFGRGYDPSELVGDRGVAGKAELRFDAHPGVTLLEDIQLYAFYDIGKIWNEDSANQEDDESASSAGFGGRFFFNKYLYGNLEFAKPLTRDVAIEGDRDPRVYFALVLSGGK